MIRIALVGDSHLANWKRAWDSFGAGWTGGELVFFAAAGTRLDCSQPRGDRLVFEDEEVAQWLEVTSGGRRELVAADYDVICVVGLRFNVRVVTDLYARWRADGHRGREGRFNLVSDACFLDAAGDRLDASQAMVLVHKLRRITDKPIVLAAQPAPSEIVLTLDKCPQGFRRATAADDAPALRATYEEVCRRLAIDDLAILDQPAATLATPILSSDRYRRPSETEIPDWTHMNDAFGEIALRELLSHLQSRFGGEPLPMPAAAVGDAEPAAAGPGAATSAWSAVKRAVGKRFIR